MWFALKNCFTLPWGAPRRAPLLPHVRRRMLFTTICKVPAPGTLQRKRGWSTESLESHYSNKFCIYFFFCACVYVLFCGWRARTPDLSTANAALHIITQVFKQLRLDLQLWGLHRVTALSSEGAFYEQSKGNILRKRKKPDPLLVALQKKGRVGHGMERWVLPSVLRQENFN